MQRFRQIFAAIVVTAALAATNSAAEARHYRYGGVYPDYICGPVPPPASLYIYPVPNWDPFFRRHMYRYGPISACAASMESTTTISVRY